MADLSGSCLCGAVKFEYSGEVHSFQACHCSRCRKCYGSAFGPIAIIDREGFAFTQGDDQIASFASSERVHRYFCKTCGSPLPMVEDWDPLVGVPLGALDGETSQRIDSHIFVTSKAPWHQITDDAVQHDEWPPGEDMNERHEELTK